MYRTGDNIYITNVGLDMDEYIRKINSIEDKDNIKVFNCASNFIYGKILKIPFPNLKKFNIKYNKIVSIEDALPKKLEYLFIDDNEFLELPKLPNKLKILTFSSNRIKKLPTFPLSLKKIHINNEKPGILIDIKKQSYECKKSLIILLKKKNFRHNFTSEQMIELHNFQIRERDIKHFEEAIMRFNNKQDFGIKNDNSKIFNTLHILFTCFTEFL